MPARPRLTSELLERITDLATVSTDPQLKEAAQMALAVHLGTEIGLSFLNRGAGSPRARQLLREYDELRMWIEAGATA